MEAVKPVKQLQPGGKELDVPATVTCHHKAGWTRERERERGGGGGGWRGGRCRNDGKCTNTHLSVAVTTVMGKSCSFINFIGFFR